MSYDEKWSYSADRIEEYILSLGASGNDHIFVLDACTVRLEPLPDRQVGMLTFPQTRIIIEGPGAETFYHDFYLHFLSGGA